MLVLMVALAGCASTTQQTARPARKHARLQRVDDRDNIALVTTWLKAVPATINSDTTATVVITDPWLDERGTVRHAYQILELEDKFVSALVLIANARILLDKMQESLTNNTPPPSWMLGHVRFLLKQAEARWCEMALVETSDFNSRTSASRRPWWRSTAGDSTRRTSPPRRLGTKVHRVSRGGFSFCLIIRAISCKFFVWRSKHEPTAQDQED